MPQQKKRAPAVRSMTPALFIVVTVRMSCWLKGCNGSAFSSGRTTLQSQWTLCPTPWKRNMKSFKFCCVLLGSRWIQLCHKHVDIKTNESIQWGDHETDVAARTLGPICMLLCKTWGACCSTCDCSSCWRLHVNLVHEFRNCYAGTGFLNATANASGFDVKLGGHAECNHANVHSLHMRYDTNEQWTLTIIQN